MKLLKKYLKDNDLTQTEFADMVGVNQGLVSMWVHDKVRMTPAWVLQVERATNKALSRYELRPDIYPRDSAA